RTEPANAPDAVGGGGSGGSVGLSVPMSEVTRILSAVAGGDPHAASQLLPLVYDELRQLAAVKLDVEKPGQTLRPTALRHEAYPRLAGAEQEPHWDSGGPFFAACAEAMRCILVDTARRRQCQKHGGGFARQVLDPEQVLAPAIREDLL